tara:strand:- start:4504 stop:5325 length:822 start_codon:yes stop_codon:yes gene_type:complete
MSDTEDEPVPKMEKDLKVKFKTPNVMPVKADVKNPRILPIHEHMIKPPALLLGIGSVRAGKTTLLNNLVFRSREDGFYDAQEYFDQIMIYSNTINNDPSARFLKKACHVTDHYDDGMIAEFIRKQKDFGERDDMPFTAMFLDDILGRNVKRNNEISFLCTRYRHMNIGLLGIFVQNFKSVDTIIRNNATDVIIFRQTNQKQLIGIAEEYHGQFGSMENFLKIYNIATSKPFAFLYLKIQEGLALQSFERVIARGSQIIGNDGVELTEDQKKLI